MRGRSLLVTTFQDQTDGPVFQPVAVFEVQMGSIGNSFACQHQKMPGKRPEPRGIRLDDDLGPEVPHLDPGIDIPGEAEPRAFCGSRDVSALDRR